jgi:DivIVA domain-containing protein
MKKKQKEQTEDTFTSTGAKPLLTPMDVQQKEFHVSRMGGYKMRDVDEFLDEITTSMSAMVEENRRLKERLGNGAMIGAPDLEEVSRQADEIIRRAREEAAQIVRDATAGAAASAQAPATAGGTGDRAAISPFLLREREFLQGLASLVQGHAEAVKTMAKDVRARAEAAVPPSPIPVAAPPPPPPATLSGPETESEGPEPEPEPVVAGPGPEPELAARSSPVPEPPTSVSRPTEAMEEPVRIEEAEPEPEPANIGRVEADDAAAGEGDRSLRELFWGED